MPGSSGSSSAFGPRYPTFQARKMRPAATPITLATTMSTMRQRRKPRAGADPRFSVDAGVDVDVLI